MHERGRGGHDLFGHFHGLGQSPRPVGIQDGMVLFKPLKLAQHFLVQHHQPIESRNLPQVP